MIVVDTNVLSELMKPSPNVDVSNWIASRNGNEIFITSITVSEILYGIVRLQDGRRKNLLQATAREIFSNFDKQILPFDRIAAEYYAQIVDSRDRLGLPIEGFDAQIAAICRVHSATLATRNVKDFVHVGIKIVNPWKK
ncbi:MAG: type II toxin-antitoxin system VapC family toxin [Acidimicrobiales bacterium]|nr:type II toxin-antitoxin system VapC family toxin [Acidimicrobiales bacterium]